MTTAHYPGRELEAMSTAENYPRWIVDAFAPYLGRRVAEVGAGIGNVSRLLLAQPLESLAAFEPSDNMYPRLEAALAGDSRARAIHGLFGTEPAGGDFDSVAYINVLEHVADDRGELERVRTALRPGGHLLVFVPALAWLYSDFDRRVGHLRRYTREGLEDVVRAAGLEVVGSRYFDVAGIMPWYVHFTLLGGGMGRATVSLYDRLVVPAMRRVESVVKPPIGKNVLLVARRN